MVLPGILGRRHTSISGIFLVRLHYSSDSWLLSRASWIHICSSVKILQMPKKTTPQNNNNNNGPSRSPERSPCLKGNYMYMCQYNETQLWRKIVDMKPMKSMYDLGKWLAVLKWHIYLLGHREVLHRTLIYTDGRLWTCVYVCRFKTLLL